MLFLKCKRCGHINMVEACEMYVPKDNRGTAETNFEYRWFWSAGPFQCSHWKGSNTIVSWPKNSDNPWEDFNREKEGSYFLSEYFELVEGSPNDSLDKTFN